LTKYCIYCGAEDSPDNPVVGGVCLRCRIKRGEVVVVEEREFRIDLCKVCGAVRIGYKWVDTHGFEDALREVVYSILAHKAKPGPGVSSLEIDSYELVTHASWRTIVRVYYKGLYGGKEFVYPVDYVVYFNPTKCPRCRMIESGEFEAVVQIRGVDKRVLEKALEKVFNRDKRLRQDLVDYIEVSNGVDIYFYNHGAARKLSRRLSSMLRLTVKENYEVAGMRSGRQRARLYISLKPYS
jgi:nonsense-mediated mRNA decay protein 3